jgi:SAM-dependent methyltransferase
MKPSGNHANRLPHNWLVYKILDGLLESRSCYIKGALYDMGCGEATFRDWLLRFADSYTGVDWSASAHDIKADIVADLNGALPIREGAADTVTALSVLEHLREPGIFLRECHRILKKNGHIIISVPFQWWEHEVPHDYCRYTSYGLRYALEKAGFEVVELLPQAGFFTMWFLKFNYFTSRSVRGPRALRFVIRSLWTPIWLAFQAAAPLLDKLDGYPSFETFGYFAVARKKA